MIPITFQGVLCQPNKLTRKVKPVKMQVNLNVIKTGIAELRFKFISTMAKFTAILFLFLFTATATELGQFLKLPLLVQHFYKHKKTEGQSLIAFLSEHYLGNHNDEDKQEDMQLPFKNFMNAPALSVFVMQQKIEVVPNGELQGQIHIPLPGSFIPSKITFQVFHPPRMVYS